MNETLLKKRLEEAPRMEPVDAVKLAFQSAFGCGHLFGDEAACLAWLQTERAATPVDPAAPAAVFLGNGLCRLNLCAPETRALPAERVLAMMRITAERRPKNAEAVRRFQSDLERLRALARRGCAPFSAAALDAYLSAYLTGDYPPVSHSEAYRAAYHPAYRVVLSDFATLLPLMAAMEKRLPQAGHAAALTVVLDGNCGAGKTTLAALLRQLYAAPVVAMDDFFLPVSLRTPQRLAEPGGNLHYERFARQVLPRLASPEGFAYERYDCATGDLLPRACPPANLRIVEGSYSLHPLFQPAYAEMDALTAFVEVGASEQLARLSRRDPARLSRFERQWIPLEKTYFEAYDIVRRAKLVLHSLPWEETA